MLCHKKIKITDLNPLLMCVLCGGYYIDATTIIECLHSFCRSCIVRYLETNKYCPICDVQVHKTKPLQNIRTDQTLQDIVYKVVPGLYQNEMRCRREFYSKHPEAKPASSEAAGELTDQSRIFLPDEAVSLSLEYMGATVPQGQPCGKRYLRCPAAVTVHHLQKLIRAKYGLTSRDRVDMMYKDDYLPDYLSLIDVAYIYQWKRKNPIHLSYAIFECQAKKMKVTHETVTEQLIDEKSDKPVEVQETGKVAVESSEASEKSSAESEVDVTMNKETESSSSKPDSEWKEVQLQISENGVMSVTGVEHVSKEEPLPVTRQNENKPIVSDANCVDAVVCDTRPNKVDNQESNKESPSLCSVNIKTIHPEAIELVKSLESDNKMEVDNTVISEKNICDDKGNSESNECNVVKQEDNKMDVQQQSVTSDKSIEVNSSVSEKDAIDVHTNSDLLLSKNITPKSEPSIASDIRETTTVKPVISHKVYPGLKPMPVTSHLPKTNFLKPNLVPISENSSKLVPAETLSSAKKQCQPIRYKTLKTPTKPWNPSIPRSTMLSMKQLQVTNNTNKDDGTSNQNQSVAKPPRFFKMRNMPRFLGNPSSGVKPMYQVAPGSELSSQQQTPSNTTPRSPKQGSTSITLMKIDPKTLSPITPTTPQPPNPQRTASSPQPKKLPPPFTPGSPNHASHYPNCRTPAHSSSNKIKAHVQRIPSPAHTGSLIPSNPFIPSVPHSANPHLLYSGFPGPFSPTDPSGNPRPFHGTNSDLIRAMNALCPPSSAFHPSLPPSISMLFNPHHAHHRLSQTDRTSFKPLGSEAQRSPTPPPAVQRVPPSSGANAKTSTDTGLSTTNLPQTVSKKLEPTTATLPMSYERMDSFDKISSDLVSTKLTKQPKNSPLQNEPKKQSTAEHLMPPINSSNIGSIQILNAVPPAMRVKPASNEAVKNLNSLKDTNENVNNESSNSNKEFVKNNSIMQTENSDAKSDYVNTSEQQNCINRIKTVADFSKDGATVIDNKHSSPQLNNNSCKPVKILDKNTPVTELVNKVSEAVEKS